MEEELDSSKGLTAIIWKKFASDLRRASLLQSDCYTLSNLLQCDNNLQTYSPASNAYVLRLREAGRIERETGTPILLGHFYTRYLADLFGGSMMGWPTKLALSLEEVPRFYIHSSNITMNRRDYVESIYESLNEAGKDLTALQQKEIVKEAEIAFQLNAALYKEGIGGPGVGMYIGAAVGGLNVVLGYGKEKFINIGKKNIVGH